jgi:bifunctional non-homologous end joining protein LigD
MLLDEIAHSVRAMSCVFDGEIACLAPDGRSVFNRLFFRRDWPHFLAFNLLAMNGEDLRDRLILERKRRLRAIMRRMTSRLVYMDHVVGRAVEFVRGRLRERPGRRRREVEIPLLSQ